MNDEDEMDREEALRVPCPYVLPASGKGNPRPCGATVGQRCRDPRSGHVLSRQPAHLPRLRAAGVAAPSVVPDRSTQGPGG